MKKDYTALVYALLVHLLLFSLIIFNWDKLPLPAKKPVIEVIQAKAVDSHAYQEKINAIQAQKKREKQQRQAAIAKEKAKARAKRKKAQEKQRQAALQKKKRAIQRRKEQEEKRKAAAREQKEALQQKKKEVERKRKLAQQRKQKEAQQRKEQQEKKLLEQQRINAEQAKQEAIAKRRNARKVKREIQRFTVMMQQQITRSWIRPHNTSSGLKCTLEVKITATGRVTMIRIIESSGNESFDRSAEIAVRKASPLPVPKNQDAATLFQQGFKLIFAPDGL